MTRTEHESNLAKAVESLQYFTAEWLDPPGRDLRVLNIRLMDLDRLLLEAKFALDKAMQAQPYWMLIPAKQAPSVEIDLIAALGIGKSELVTRRI